MKNQKGISIITILVIVAVVVVVTLGGYFGWKTYQKIQQQSTVVTPKIETETISEGELLDTDNDGLTDEEEKKIGTDLNYFDTDNDGLSDGDEVNKYKTDPLKADTDNDGYDDKTEISTGHDPLSPPQVIAKPEYVDCGTFTIGSLEELRKMSESYECLIRAVNNDCEFAKSTTNFGGIDILEMGVLAYGTTTISVKKGTQDNCFFTTEYGDQDIKYSEKIINQLLSSGLTREDIAKQEEEGRKTQKLVANKYVVCKLNKSEIVDNLNKWKEGRFSSEDVPKEKCRGTLFGWTLHSWDINEKCQLKMITTPPLGIPIDERIKYGAEVSGYQGSPSEVEWLVEDSSLINIVPLKGVKVELQSLGKKGSTKVKVVDNSIGQECVLEETISVGMEF